MNEEHGAKTIADTNRRVMATVRVRVELEVESSSHWGHDVRADQLFTQAGREVLLELEHKLRGAGIAARLIGTPKVIAVFAESNVSKS